MLTLWTALEKDNEFLPPAQVSTDRADRALPILQRLVGRLLPDLPGPAPEPYFDPASATAMARVVASALLRVGRRGAELLPAIQSVPPPTTPAGHVTQAAIGWFALPLLARMRSDAFRAFNAAQPDAEHLEAITAALADVLARAPLLSLREDAEAALADAGPPALDGVEDAPALRRWIVQRLASNVPSAAAGERRAAILHALSPRSQREVRFLLPENSYDGNAEDR